MRKLAFLMALILTLGVAGMASATVPPINVIITAAALNNNDGVVGGPHDLAKHLTGTGIIAGPIADTGDTLTIQGDKLNGLGWSTLKKAIDDWSKITGNVSFNLELNDQDEIPANQFKGVEAITSISFGNSGLPTTPITISKINDGAFEDMTELESFVLNQPAATITVLPDNMLKGASGLTSVYINTPSITTIGANAFGGASKLAGVPAAFAGQPIITSGNVTTIEAGAFAGTAITTFPIAPAMVGRLVTIGDGAFENCKKLATVNLDAAEKLVTIGDNAFSGDVKLDAFRFPDPVNIPGGVAGVDMTNELVTIGSGAFKGCTILRKSLTPGAPAHTGFLNFFDFRKLETIGASAFEDCGEITRIDFTNVDSLTTIGDNAFKNAKKLVEIGCDWTIAGVFNSDAFERGTAFTSFGSNVFYGTQLVGIVLDIRFADSVAKIGTNAFWQMRPLVVFRYDTDKPALTTPKALADFLRSLDMAGAFAGALVDNNTISIADSAFKENGRTLSNLGIVLENRVENPDTRVIIGSLYRAGFTPARIVQLFDTANGGAGSLINPTYPLTIDVVESVVKGIIENGGEYDYEGDYMSDDPSAPGGPADPGTPGGGGDDEDELPAGGSSGCDVTGFAPLAALLALGLAKVRKARG